MVISVLNQKGGVGKTTLSVHIASTLSLGGYSTLLIDADVQRSSLDWAATRTKDPLFSVVGISTSNIHKEVRLLENKYEFIVIDGPPRIYDVARSVIAASDFVLIPVQPSPYDIWSAKEIVDLVKEMKSTLAVHKKIEAAFIINRCIKNTVIGRDVHEALAEYNLPVLKQHIFQKIIYAETAAHGTTAIEEEPDSSAGKEIKNMVEEVLALYAKSGE